MKWYRFFGQPGGSCNVEIWCRLCGYPFSPVSGKAWSSPPEVGQKMHSRRIRQSPSSTIRTNGLIPTVSQLKAGDHSQSRHGFRVVVQVGDYRDCPLLADLLEMALLDMKDMAVTT